MPDKDKKFPPKDQNTGKDKFDVEELDKQLEDVSGGSCDGCDSCSGGPGTGCEGCGAKPPLDQQQQS